MDGDELVSGLEPTDFVVTIDGVSTDRFTLTLPPSQDATQKVSILIIANIFDSALAQLIRQLDSGDFAAVVKYKPCLELFALQRGIRTRIHGN